MEKGKRIDVVVQRGTAKIEIKSEETGDVSFLVSEKDVLRKGYDTLAEGILEILQ